MISTIGVTLLIILVLLLLAGREAAALLPTDTTTPERDTTPATAPSPTPIDDPSQMQLELLTLEDRIESLEILLADAQDAAQMARTDALLDADVALQAAQRRHAAAIAGELEELRTRRRVTYLLDTADSNRVPLIIELGGGRAVLATGSDSEAAFALHASGPASLAKKVHAWIESLPDRDRLMLVFVVRPSGIDAWHRLQASIPKWSGDGLGYGLDLIAESWSTSGLHPGTETP
jgi:hypothetical protein